MVLLIFLEQVLQINAKQKLHANLLHWDHWYSTTIWSYIQRQDWFIQQQKLGLFWQVILDWSSKSFLTIAACIHNVEVSEGSDQNLDLASLDSIACAFNPSQNWYFFANGEDPDEIPHNEAFHQGLHYLQRQNNLQGEKTIIFGNVTCDPSIYTMDHPKVIVPHLKE